MRFGTFYHKGLDNIMVQINKLKAERLFNAGKTVYLLPCLCSPDSYLVSLCPINIEHCYDNSFKNIVNDFTYYSCCNELGRYPVTLFGKMNFIKKAMRKVSENQ